MTAPANTSRAQRERRYDDADVILACPVPILAPKLCISAVQLLIEAKPLRLRPRPRANSRDQNFGL